MRLAYMLAMPDACPFPLAWNGDPGAVLARVGAIGYTGIELQLRDPATVQPAALLGAAGAAGLRFAGLSTGPSAFEGLFLMAPDANVRKRARDRFARVLELGAELGCHASIGIFRGKISGAPSRDVAIGWFTEALQSALERAAELHVRIVLEPMARQHCDWLNTIGETIRYIREFDSPWLSYEADLHHQLSEERSILASLVEGRRSGLMTHVQVSDSNWRAPGCGSFNWIDILGTLDALGYDGWIVVECLQDPDSDDCARRAYSTLHSAHTGEPSWLPR